MVEIRVEGNRRVEAAAIERALVQKRGDAFDPSKTAEDLRALWRLGYFSDVELLVQNLPQGGVAYLVRVEERAAIREVRLQGLKELSKEDFKETLDLKANSILDLEQVRKNAKKIQEKYVEKGFFLADVTWRLEKVAETNQIDVVFVINEHSKVQVREITFVGNAHLGASELKEVMVTKEASLLSFISGEGTYREEMFQRDLQAILAAYYDRGFVNVRVEKPVVSISPDKRDIFITLHIQEGEQYLIGKIDFSGELVVPKERLAVLMASSEGTLFNRSLLSRDIQVITDVYYDRGFAYANINPLTRVSAQTKTIDLTFDVQKGKQVSIERIEITGNSKTRDKVIRRELRVYEGELFSGSGLRRSQERVNALGYFETVEVTHRPGSADDRIV
ncbi:MAG TPA: outer membrane protein assembly factor BamA, partial [Myxococcaceae bacterium]|nr:outer membrane protein assembly factor BamA [Myxococcaceae bacterium]